MKFSPARLSDCKAKIDILAPELQKYALEATALVNELGQGGRYRLMQPLTAITDAIADLAAASGKLEKLADHYRECEKTVQDIVRRLDVPTPCSAPQGPTGTPAPFVAGYAVSHTTPRDLFVESWVMELMYSEACLE